MVKGRNAPLRETAIVLMLLNHPRLIEEDFETMAALDLEHDALKVLHLAMLDVLASNHVEDGYAMRKALVAAGHVELIETLEAVVRRTREWTATAQAAEDDVREALKQALHLHQRARTLHRSCALSKHRLIVMKRVKFSPDLLIFRNRLLRQKQPKPSLTGLDFHRDAHREVRDFSHAVCNQVNA